MTRRVKIATVQPPVPGDGLSGQRVRQIELALLDEALADRPDIVCLPEYSNCVACAPQEHDELFGPVARELLDSVAARARAARCYAILPLVIDVDGRRYNRAHLLDRDGRLIGHFDKVHVTQVEREQFGVVAGSEWPVFDVDFGRLGIMICYDGCFVESSRILAIQGAEIIFWPSLQRSYSAEQLELQTRSHAYFNYSVIVRSSFGGQTSNGDNPHRMAGLSCICGADGAMRSSLVGQSGWVAAEVDLDRRPRGARTHGGQVGCLRQMRFEDRRPVTYELLATPPRPQGEIRRHDSASPGVGEGGPASLHRRPVVQPEKGAGPGAKGASPKTP